MILLVHMIFGAAIGSAVRSMPLAIIFAFLSHYFLDSLPHVDYNIEIGAKKYRHEKIFNILKIILDFCLGALLISMFSKNWLASFVCAFFALLPDGFTVLNNHMTNKFLKIHREIHEKIHFLKHKKISNFWRIFTQVIIVMISIVLLKL